MVKKEGCYLLCGQEEFLKEEASRRLISLLLPTKESTLDCDIYNAKDDYSEIFKSLDTSPFLSDKRVIVIKDIEYLPESKKDSFLSYIKRPEIHTYLVLHTKKTPSNDKFIEAISSYTETLSFKRLDKREAKEWIYKRLNGYKKSITKEALELLLELKGSSDLFILSGELEKLVTYKKDDRTITKEDVAGLVGKSITKRAFDLIEAISSKDRDSALSLIRELSLNDKDNIPEIMGLMGWQLRRIWKAKMLLNRRWNKHRIAGELKIKSFSIDRFLSQVDRFSIDELKRAIRLLVDADHDTKRSSHRPGFVLEGLIIKLCAFRAS